MKHAAYHVHLYFDENTLEQAVKLGEQANEKFTLNPGRVHQKNVGPHPCWSQQLAFDGDQYDSLIPWLDENRNGLTILIHGLSGDNYKDHTEHASWLGTPVALNLEIFM